MNNYSTLHRYRVHSLSPTPNQYVRIHHYLQKSNPTPFTHYLLHSFSFFLQLSFRPSTIDKTREPSSYYSFFLDIVSLSLSSVSQHWTYPIEMRGLFYDYSKYDYTYLRVSQLDGTWIRCAVFVGFSSSFKMLASRLACIVCMERYRGGMLAGY